MITDKAMQSGKDQFALADQLLAMLRQQVEHQRSLIALVKRKREAIRIADFPAIQNLCKHEQRVIGAVTALERQREACTRKLTAVVSPGAREALTISGIAQAIGGNLQEELLKAADELRELMRQLQHESSVVRRAAEALSGHMTGIMQAVQGAFSATPTYGAKGRIRGGAQLEYSVDVQS
jgi:hypothetical protein